MLYGAIIGDIAGSKYEFANIKRRPKIIMDEDCHFTDDTVMTIAIAHAFLAAPFYDYEYKMKGWFNLYPMAGYGEKFRAWAQGAINGPYNSFGNGSAMRVSPAAYVGNNLKQVRFFARKIAEVTHNHPEGVEGAEAVASAIFLAREGHDKEEIKEYIIDNFKYKIDPCDIIRPTYDFDETCQGIVPQAIAAFLESNSFSDCIKLAISLGGDSDTLAAIAGSIAEPYYGIPAVYVDRCRQLLPNIMLSIIDDFEKKYI